MEFHGSLHINLCSVRPSKISSIYHIPEEPAGTDQKVVIKIQVSGKEFVINRL